MQFYLSMFDMFCSSCCQGPCLPLERSPLWTVLHVVEGLALVVLCSCRPATRRLAVNVLKEVRSLHAALGIAKVTIPFKRLSYSTTCNHPLYQWTPHTHRFLLMLSLYQGDEELAIDVMDRLSASVLESFIHLTGADQVKKNSNDAPIYNILITVVQQHWKIVLVLSVVKSAILPQWNRPSDSGWVELLPYQPPVWCGKPLTHLGLCTCDARSGPLGDQPVQLPAAGAPAQTLSICTELRLGLCLHTPPAALTTSRHQVCFLILFI